MIAIAERTLYAVIFLALVILLVGQRVDSQMPTDTWEFTAEMNLGIYSEATYEDEFFLRWLPTGETVTIYAPVVGADMVFWGALDIRRTEWVQVGRIPVTLINDETEACVIWWGIFE